MSWALFCKTLADARWFLPALAGFMFFLQWLRVWIVGQVPAARFRALIDLAPDFIKQLIPVPIEQLVTPAGRIALSYDDPLVLLIVVVWSIARGSDAVSGELNRGTMEMLLAQPVSRLAVLWSQAAGTLCGLVALTAAAWLGTWVGIETVVLEERVEAGRFLPAAINLGCLGCCLAGITTLLSSWDDSRWRTIALAGQFYVIQTVMRIVALAVPGWRWLLKLTIFTPFDPEGLVAHPELAWTWWSVQEGVERLGGWGCHAVLLGLGLVGYALASVVFQRRDLPAPL
jgi:ABC-2 type transport system permease protein